ncbi:MAG: hypothetical protein KKD59_07730 [Acidobacteria bacterium]|nr:hypothetical protein [Acidobacteriota bacterium]
MYRFWTILFISGAFLYTSFARQADNLTNSVSMPPEALQMVQALQTESHPLSLLGQKAVLSRFALYYQENISHPLAQKKYQECKESESSRDCETEYMAWFNTGKKRDEYRIALQNAEVDWFSSWLSRMGIPTLPDVSSGEVDIQGESKKDYDLFLKWRDANGYSSRTKELGNLEAALYLHAGIEEQTDPTPEQAFRIAATLLEIYWKKASLQEEYMCRFLLTVLGKNPLECLEWRSRGIPVEPARKDRKQSPDVIVALYPRQFSRPADVVELYVRVIEPDDRIVAGTSVHLVPNGNPEDSEEYLTDSEGIAKITFIHRDAAVRSYSYTIYTRGMSKEITIPVITAEVLKSQLENMTDGGGSVHPYGEDEEELLTAARVVNGWQIDIVTYDDWVGIEEINTRLQELAMREVRKVGRSRRFRLTLPESDAAAQALIQLKIMLDFTIRE